MVDFSTEQYIFSTRHAPFGQISQKIEAVGIKFIQMAYCVIFVISHMWLNRKASCHYHIYKGAGLIKACNFFVRARQHQTLMS